MKEHKVSGSSIQKNIMPVLYFGVWLAALLFWELFLRICISGGIRPGNLTFLAFLPAEALFLTVLSGLFKNHRIISGICNMVLALGLSVYYFAQLVYFRVAGSLLPVGMIGMGDKAVEDFGWTIQGVLVGSLILVPLILLPVIAIGLLSLKKGLFSGKENTDHLVLGGYALWLRPVCLILAALLWIMGSFSLALFGRGRDSAWYVYHSELSDTDTSAERIGALTTTIVELYIYQFGQDRDLSQTVNSGINMEALELPDKGREEQKADTAVKTESDGSENASEPEEVFVPVARQNDKIDFHALAGMAEDENTKVLCEYFASRRPTATNEYTGLFEGYNLVYLCCEAFSGYGIDPQITPTLYKMANNGIVLDNFYNSFPNITTNGEFAFATALWPDVSRSASNGVVAGSFPQSAGVFMPYGLGDLLTADGVNCYAYHNYRGDYYMRDYSWPNLGYPNDNMKFMGRGMVFSNPWPASDLEMLEQSADDYVNEDRFHAYYMTFSGHGPYDDTNYMFRKNIGKVRELAGDRYKNEYCLGYFCGEYELELAMEYLLQRLEEAGQLEKTVIVLIGDHFPYYLPDEAVKEFNGGSMPDSITRSRSTCIIYNAGMSEPIHSDVPCCNVDILPTILNLFNIDFDSRLLMGTDIFSDGVHRARLYNGSFVTKYLTYDRTTGDKEWSADAAGMSEDELEAYSEAMLDYTESEYAVSLGMIENNFYFYVWKNAGLLSAEEIEAETAREKKGKSVYQSREAADKAKAEEEARKKAEQEALENGEVIPGGEGEQPPADTQQPAPAENAAPAPETAPAPAPTEQAQPAPTEPATPAPEG